MMPIQTISPSAPIRIRPVQVRPAGRRGRPGPRGPQPSRPVAAPPRYRGTGVLMSTAPHRPRPITPATTVALALLGVAALTTPGGARHYLTALAGLAAAGLVFAAQALIYPAGLGWGDVKLSGLLGGYLGWLGVGPLVTGLVAGYLLAAGAGLVLLAARRAGAIGIGLLSGGYGREELERAGAYRVYSDPAYLLARADELGVRDLT